MKLKHKIMIFMIAAYVLLFVAEVIFGSTQRLLRNIILFASGLLFGAGLTNIEKVN